MARQLWPKRVLLTGASGFIGSNVLEYLLKETDWEFTCLCSWRHKGSPLNMQTYFDNPRVEVITLDLIGNIPNIGEFEYILHLASESHVDRSIAEPVSFVENNISSTLQMLEYARKCNPQVFVLFSTDEVYGAAQHQEWDVLLPSNPYSASKAAQEMIAIAYWKTYDIPLVITNSNNIVGPNQNAEKFLPKIIKLIREGKDVDVHTSNGQPGKRYYNPVQNVADALMFILNELGNPAKHTGDNRPDRYNLPGGQELDNLEMATLVAKILGKVLKYKLVDASSIRPGYDQFYPKTEGRLTKLGWVPPFEFEWELAAIISKLEKQ